jgi:hypothetical protein
MRGVRFLIIRHGGLHRGLRRAGFGFGNGFVIGFVVRFDGFRGGLGAEGFEALEILDGAAIKTLRLGLEAEEHVGGLELLHEAIEAEGEPIGAVLSEGDLDAGGEFGPFEDEGLGGAFHGLVEAIGEEAGFESGCAQQGLLGEGDAFDGEEFLGVDGPIDGDGVGAEVGDGLWAFDADNGEVFGVEGVFAGILRGAGFAGGGFGAGGTGGVSAIGRESLGGHGFGVWHASGVLHTGRGGGRGSW